MRAVDRVRSSTEDKSRGVVTGRVQSPDPTGGHAVLVGGGKDFGLHQLHRLAAAFDVTVAGLDAEDFRRALLALKPLTELVSHPVTPYVVTSAAWAGRSR